MRKFNWSRWLLPALVSMFVATFIAWAAQTNYLGTVFIADSTTPSQQLAINSSGQASVTSLPDSTGASVISTTITRPADTTAYAANDTWANATSSATYSTFTNICRVNGGVVLIPQIDISVDENPATKLQGAIWFFDTVVSNAPEDNAAFVIPQADFANLTGNKQGFAFTLVNNQQSGATDSGISLTGTTYVAKCAAGSRNLYALVEVNNVYTPTSAEVLTMKVHTIAVN